MQHVGTKPAPSVCGRQNEHSHDIPESTHEDREGISFPRIEQSTRARAGGPRPPVCIPPCTQLLEESHSVAVGPANVLLHPTRDRRATVSSVKDEFKDVAWTYHSPLNGSELPPEDV